MNNPVQIYALFLGRWDQKREQRRNIEMFSVVFEREDLAAATTAADNLVCQAGKLHRSGLIMDLEPLKVKVVKA